MESLFWYFVNEISTFLNDFIHYPEDNVNPESVEKSSTSSEVSQTQVVGEDKAKTQVFYKNKWFIAGAAVTGILFVGLVGYWSSDFIASNFTTISTSIAAAMAEVGWEFSSEPKAVPEPSAAPVPEPSAAPVPEPAAAPVPEPATAPVPEPAAALVPEPAAAPVPEPAKEAPKVSKKRS